MNADDQPAEAAAVHADDSVVEALNGRAVRTTGTAPVEAELVRLVLAWKHEIDAEAFPPPLDELTIRRVLPVRVRRRVLTPVAAAAAAVGIALSGVTLLAHGAQPGDPLWGVTQVVYADHARSVAATTDAQADLGVAQRALAAGAPDAARTALARVSSALRSVRDPDLRAKLSATLTSLTAQLTQEPPPVVATPSSPPVVATLPPVARVTVAPTPGPAPGQSGTPTGTPAPTTIPPSGTEPPATSAAAPPTAAATTVMPAPTSAPTTTGSGPQAPPELTPQSTTPPSAAPAPVP
ncbi:MAG: hypothetical protein ABI251_04455 [Mycobacteriaceae bacterium]